MERKRLPNLNPQQYVEVKLTEAQEMTLGEYNNFRGWTIPEDENPDKSGYIVIDKTNNHLTWQPKEVFEKYNLKLNGELGVGKSIYPPNNLVECTTKDFVMDINVTPGLFNKKRWYATAILKNGHHLSEDFDKNEDIEEEKDIDICKIKIIRKAEEYMRFLLGLAMGGVTKDE